MKHPIWKWLATEPSAPTPIWKKRFGPEFQAFKRAFLRPVKGLSPTYPCDTPNHPGCGAFTVRKQSKGYVGVCEASVCPKQSFSEDDLVQLEITPNRAISTLASGLGLDVSVSLSESTHGIWHIGRHRPNAHFDFAVFVVMPPEDQDPNAGIRDLLNRHPEPFLLGVISESDLTVETRARLSNAKVQLFGLDAVAALSGAKLTASTLWGSLIERFNAQAVPQPEFRTSTAKKYPTPPKACWADVHIRFQNGHEVLIRVDPEERWTRYGYKDMGMADKKSGNPVRAWLFLEELSIHSGGPLNQVKSEIESGGFPERSAKELNAALTAFFRLSGRPVPYIKRHPKGYQTEFFVYPEGAE